MRPVVGHVLYDAAAGADALLILTDWEEFASLDLAQLRELLRYPVIIDGRNLYDPTEMAEHGFIYSSVGRKDVLPAKPAITPKAARSTDRLKKTA